MRQAAISYRNCAALFSGIGALSIALSTISGHMAFSRLKGEDGVFLVRICAYGQVRFVELLDVDDDPTPQDQSPPNKNLACHGAYFDGRRKPKARAGRIDLKFKPERRSDAKVL